MALWSIDDEGNLWVARRAEDGKFLTVATDELDIQYAVVAVIER